MKTLIYATALTLAIPFGIAWLQTSSAPPAYAKGVLRDAKAPHLVHNNAHPNNARVQNATHHFQVHIQGSDLSQLSVDVPEGVRLGDRIVVTDESGKKVNAKISIDDKRITIIFEQPVPSGTTLTVSLKGVSTRFLSRGHVWLYSIYGRSVGMKEDVRIGLAQIQTR